MVLATVVWVSWELGRLVAKRPSYAAIAILSGLVFALFAAGWAVK
jgi:hypothetical protein